MAYPDGKTMRRPRLSLAKCQRGATALEYGLILALIALAVVGSITLVADKTINIWGHVSNEVSKH